MESNYITRGCAVFVTTAAISDQQRKAGRKTVALHTYPCNILQYSRQHSPPTATDACSISTKLLKTTCKIELSYTDTSKILTWERRRLLSDCLGGNITAFWLGEGLLQGFNTDLQTPADRAIKHQLQKEKQWNWFNYYALSFTHCKLLICLFTQIIITQINSKNKIKGNCKM